jgi:Tat protein translocase TatC
VNDDSKMTFMDHLEELRKCLIISIAAVLVGMIICWFFRDAVLSFLLSPLYEAWRQVDGLEEPRPLNFTSMLEPFVAYLKLSAIGGIFLGSPVVLYQLWKFVSPGLYAKEKRLAIPFVLASTLLFAGGSTMAYSMVFPIGFRFFLEFATGQEMTETSAEITVTSGHSRQKSISPPKTDTKDAADAGPDASVEKNASSPMPSNFFPSKDTASKEKTSPGFGASLLGRIFSDDCGELSIRPTADQKGAELSIVWHRVRCGPLPEQIRVRRGKDIIRPKWQSVSSEDIDRERFVATDHPPAAGTFTYVLKTPKNPSAHRLMPVLTIKDYLSFAVRLLLAFGLIFEMPILISFLSLAGIVNYRQLIHFFRYFLVLAFVIGALLTPPDVITQALLAAPLIVLYALSIAVAYIFGEKQSEG